MTGASPEPHPPDDATPAPTVATVRPELARRVAPVVFAAATMAVLGVLGLGRHGAMGNDEVATRWAARLSLRQLAHLLDHIDAVHGLYYLLIHGWIVLGSSPTVMRIPSVIAMTAAVAVVVVIGRRLTGSAAAGLIAGLAVALTPSISFYAQTARSYALVYLDVAVSTLVLLRALDGERDGAGTRTSTWRNWALYAALITLGGYLNELSLLALAAHAVTVLIARYGRRAVASWFGAAAIGAALVVPLIVISKRQDSALASLRPANRHDIAILLHDYFGAATFVEVLLILCVLAALAWPLGRTPLWRHRGGVTVVTVALPLLVVPAVVLIVESRLAEPLYFDRYVLYGEIGAGLLVGSGLVRIGQALADVSHRRLLVAVPGAVVCVCVLLAQIGDQHRIRQPSSRTFDFGSPARYVAAHSHKGDAILFFGPFFRKIRLGYPSDFVGIGDIALAVSPLKAGDFDGTDKPVALVRPILLRQDRVWVVGKYPTDVPALSPRIKRLARLLKTRYGVVDRQEYGRITVSLWRRR